MEDKIACWWSSYRSWYYTLSTLSCPLNPWEEPPGYERVYSDGTFSFYESEIAGNYDELEEALWAVRNGL